MIRYLASFEIDVLKVYMCPDHWDDNSFMRKPAPGMFFQAAKDFNLRLDRCIYIGDDERDCIAATNAGCGMIYLNCDEIQPNLCEFPKPFYRYKNLLEAVTKITDWYSIYEK